MEVPCLDEVAHVVDAVLAEQAVAHHAMHVKQISDRIRILRAVTRASNNQHATLDRLAVNTTTSYSSPTRLRNVSTCGRFRTYTWADQRKFSSSKRAPGASDPRSRLAR